MLGGTSKLAYSGPNQKLIKNFRKLLVVMFLTTLTTGHANLRGFFCVFTLQL
jgi:hypothetical protein